MPTPSLSEFTHWKFDSPQEEKQAHILPSANLAFIKNQLADALLERARLDLTDLNPNWRAQEASLMGQIQAFTFLINTHEDEINGLKNLDHPSTY